MRVGENDRTALLDTAKELAAHSIKENGCAAYDVFESATRRDVMMICETWRNDAALAAHRSTEHFTRLSPQLHAMAEMKAERFEF